MSEDDLMFFDEEEDEGAQGGQQSSWKLMVVDDEEEIHRVTKLVLNDYVLEGKSLEIISAYSAKEAKSKLEEHKDIAVILLDVVMESDHAGLELVQYIRGELKNVNVRIILRTGQPGIAPERNVILDYDINDYKEKSELTAQKLFSSVTTALRSFSHLHMIELSRTGLEQIIDSSAELFRSPSLQKFAQGVLTQLLALLSLDENSLYFRAEGFSAARELNESDLTLLAATGKYEPLVGQKSTDELPPMVRELFTKDLPQGLSQFHENEYLGVFAVSNRYHYILYFCSEHPLNEIEQKLVQVFASNVGVAFENLKLNQEIVDTQSEMIETLGEVIESRSKETAHHVKRVAESAYLLAKLHGLDEEECQLVRLASPMHDLGKIGIPEAIINKPAKLDQDEFEYIKSHPEIGFELLKNSERPLMRAAAIVAHQHHEKWSGKGYPQGLKGEEIHIFARIIGLVDVFDAVIHDRCYKKAWPLEDVIRLFEEERGKHFDPNLTDLFLKNIDQFMQIRAKYAD